MDRRPVRYHFTGVWHRLQGLVAGEMSLHGCGLDPTGDSRPVRYHVMVCATYFSEPRPKTYHFMGVQDAAVTQRHITTQILQGLTTSEISCDVIGGCHRLQGPEAVEISPHRRVP
ncbi:hypothetical protein NDU88_004387 [Pleurodeles waltl]|uniref:Uncharacterized protein n=1 Tax=Pleurodeles waltl TaxID=8319 RepID=A0AAV7V4A6_PLEWA|nr:hypothetical protein NDU88_004387 [Pleurodeles waltl]